MNKKMILFSIGLTIANSIFSQDFTFSQYEQMPMLQNPAFAGIGLDGIRVASGYRSQWASVTVPFETITLSVEANIPVDNENSDYITIGTQIIKDQAGDSKLSRTQAEPVINFHKCLDKDYDKQYYLSFSIMGGLVQSQFDPTTLTFDDQFVAGHFDPLNPTQAVLKKTSISYIDGSAGLSFSSGTSDESSGSGINFYLGAACYHLLKPNVSYFDYDNNQLKQRFVLNAGCSILDYENTNRVYFYGDYIIQGGARQFLSSVLYSKNIQGDRDETSSKIFFGAAYRWADALVPILKLKKVSENNEMLIGVSYDFNISKLRTASQYRGGLEITASFQKKLSRYQGIPCYKFLAY